MPNLSVSIPHQLPRAEAKKRVEGLISQLKNDYGGDAAHVDESWAGDTLTFKVAAMGMSLAGQVAVEDQAVKVDVALPFMLAMLSGRVKQTIEEEGRKLLAQA